LDWTQQAVIERNDGETLCSCWPCWPSTLLTLLGKAGQELGMDRMLGATRPRQLSLFRQGLMLFELIPKMRKIAFALWPRNSENCSKIMPCLPAFWA